MGVVYKARQLGVDRVVALKLLAADGFHDLQRFQRECQTLSKLEHPAIVRVFAWGTTTDSAQYLAMEYVVGRTLYAVIAEGGALEVAAVVAMAEKLCAALSYAHALGIVHRDIKPANIMVMDDGGVKLLDFGLAKFVGSDLRVTRTEAIVGTPVYMAPEQFMSKEVGPRSDVYQLSCTLYEALSGRPAFGGDSPFEIFNAHSTGAYEPLPESVPLHVRAALDKALQADPLKRFATAEEFASALNGDVPVVMVSRTVARRSKAAKRLDASATVIRLGAALLVALGVAGGVQWYLQYDSLASQARRAENVKDYKRASTLYQSLYEKALAEKGLASIEAREAARALARNERASGDLRALKETWRSKIAWWYERDIAKTRGAKAHLPIREREIQAAQQVLPPDSFEIGELMAQQAWQNSELKRNKLALQQAKAALSIFEKEKNDSPSDSVATAHRVIGDVACRNNDLRTGVDEYNKAIALLVDLRLRHVHGSYIDELENSANYSEPLRKTRTSLVRVYMAQKRWQEALKVFDDLFAREFIESIMASPNEFKNLHALQKKCEDALVNGSS